MIDTYKKYPFWRTRLEDVDAALDSAKLGQVHVMGTSAGGRTIRYITYGEKVDYNRTANYSSAIGAGDASCYADRTGKRPTIMLIGATHGQETEGTAALLNLISLLETGKDLRGEEVPAITDSLAESDPRLVIIPVYNVDGRSRCVPDSMIGDPQDTLRYYGQGTWKDGSLCGWPACKKIHPIKDAAGFLGAYYNDDGVNLMHDNFFMPIAPETKVLLALADAESPECVIGLHGGSNSLNVLLQPAHVPLPFCEAIYRLAENTAARQQARGIPTKVYPVGSLGLRPSFDLTSALHHLCGAVSVTYESNEGLSDRPNPFTAEEILLSHYCLFESMLNLAWRE